MNRKRLNLLNKSLLCAPFIILCILIVTILSESCNDISQLTEPTYVNNPYGQVVRPGTPTITNTQNAYAYSINATLITLQHHDSLRFDTSTISYSIIVSGFKEGNGIISLIDSEANILLRDTIKSDTVLANSNFTVNTPKMFTLSLTRFTGIIIIEVTKKDYGMTATIFGLWNWEYNAPAFSPENPTAWGFHVLLNLSQDYKWSIILGDTVAFQGNFSIDRKNSLMSWSGNIPRPFNPVAHILGSGTYFYELPYPDTLSLSIGSESFSYFSRVKLMENGMNISEPPEK